MVIKRKPPYISGAEFSDAMAFLKRAGISHKEFCEITGFSPQQIARWKKQGAPQYVEICLRAARFGLQEWNE